MYAPLLVLMEGYISKKEYIIYVLHQYMFAIQDAFWLILSILIASVIKEEFSKEVGYSSTSRYERSQSGSHLSTLSAHAYSSGKDGQRLAAQADQDAYP